MIEDINHQFAALTPEQRQLIELMLRKKDGNDPDSQYTSSPQSEPEAPTQHRMTGLVPLTGPQKWFFENINDYYGDWWNKSALYEVPSFVGRTPELIAKVFEHLLAYHDELRAYFVQQETGWQQIIAEPGGEVPFKYENLADLEPTEQDRVIKAASEKLQLDLDLAIPPLVGVMLFYLGESQPARLLICQHHLIMDGVSTIILAGDFQTAYEQLLQGKPVHLLPPTSSVQQYVERLRAYAISNEMRRELDDYWLTLPWNQVAPLPVDDPAGETRRIFGLMASVEVTLDADETRILQTMLPRVCKAQLSDALLMAVLQVVTHWTGRSHQLIGWVDSSRGSGIFGQTDLDVSHTIGWLGLDSYLLLEQLTTRSPLESLQAIQEQMRRIPHKGMGWYLLRYYGETEIVERVRPLINNATVVMVNYIGTMADASISHEILHLLGKLTGIPHDPQGRDFHPRLFITAYIAQGCFSASWQYNLSEYDPATIERIAFNFKIALQALILACKLQATI